MLDPQLIQTARRNIRSLLDQCNVAYEVTPFDEDLYQECIDDAMRHGYSIDSNPSVRTYLREGVVYAATAVAHLSHRPTRIWVALYTSCTIFLDEAATSFPEEIPNVCLFPERLIRGEVQGNGALSAFADIIHRSSGLYEPIASHLITKSTLAFVAANLLEHETRFMKISSAAQQYPDYQRIMSGDSEAFGFFVFPREIPVNDYIQAIPEITLIINNINDVLSFYKEERVGETTNQISTLAGRTGKSKLDTYGELTETTIGLYKRILNILEGSPEACNTFKHFTAGYVRFHTSTSRYQLEELGLGTAQLY